MTLEIEQNIDTGRLNKGTNLKEWLDSLDDEESNLVIGYRCLCGSVPTDIDRSDDHEWMKFEINIETLTDTGIAFISEEEAYELFQNIPESIEQLCEDHEAWAVLTLLKVRETESFEDCYFEADIYYDAEKINEIGVDLIGYNTDVELFTCKFNISTQHEEASRRLDGLSDLSEDINEETLVCIGTLSLQYQNRIESYIDVAPDKILTAEDMLNISD